MFELLRSFVRRIRIAFRTKCCKCGTSDSVYSQCVTRGNPMFSPRHEDWCSDCWEIKLHDDWIMGRLG